MSRRAPALIFVAAALLLPASATADDAGSVDVGTPSEPAVVDTAPLTGDVVLRFEGLREPSPRTLAALVADPSIAGTHRLLGSWPVFRIEGAPDVDPVALAATLASRPDVAWAEPDRVLTMHADEPPVDDPMWDELWHLENTGTFSRSRPQADINVRPAWELATGEGVIIAIIDTGVDMDHPDLAVLPEGYDAFDDDLIPEPDYDNHDGYAHGTAVAGLAAATGNNGIGTAGVAYDAEVYGVRLLGVTGLTISDMYDSLVAPVDAGADVLNNSWGNIDSECTPVPVRPAINQALEYARLEGRDGLGTVVVFSAGNSGCEMTEYPMQTMPGVISVGSLRDDDVKFGYSVWGPLLDIMAPSGRGSHQGLRTTDIYGDRGYNGRGENDEYTHRMSGTSGAAPIVAGVAGLMISANPRITEADVQRVICDTAVRVAREHAEYNEVGWSPLYGCGRVDAGAAVKAVANGAPGAPRVVFPADGATVSTVDTGLRWEPAEDPDGDLLRYELEILDLLAPEGDDDDSAGDDDDSAEAADPVRTWLLDETTINLTGELGVGEYAARLWAVDAWGRGEVSETVRFEVVPSPPPPDPPPPVEDADCACTSSFAGSWTPLAPALIGLIGVVSRRRRPRGRSPDRSGR